MNKTSNKTFLLKRLRGWCKRREKSYEAIWERKVSRP